MTKEEINLSKDFRDIHDSEWKELIIKDLKGKSYEDTLIWKTNNELELNPYYRQSDNQKIKNLKRFSNTSESFIINQNFNADDSFNQKAIKSLMNGAESIGCVLTNTSLLKECLSDILIDAIPIHLYGDVTENTLNDLVEIIEDRSISFSDCSGTLDFAPLTVSAKVGQKTQLNLLAKILKNYEAALPNFRKIHLDIRLFKNAGANEIEEIAIALAQLNEYIIELSQKDISKEIIAKNLSFSFSFSTSYFIEIAKLRAFKFLAKALLNEYQIKAEIDVKAETASLMYSSEDSYTNILRATSAAMSAVIGGCNSLTVLPHDFPFYNQTEFAERIARNVQIIMKEEAHFAKVKDVSAGAYYIEHLSDAMAEKAWKLFQEIEQNGGYTAALKANYIQELIEESKTKTIEDLKSTSKVMVGLNKYQSDTKNKEMLKSIPKMEGLDFKSVQQIRWSEFVEKNSDER